MAKSCPHCGVEIVEKDGRTLHAVGAILDHTQDNFGYDEVELLLHTREDCDNKDLTKALIKEIKALHETIKEWAGLYVIEKKDIP